MRNSRTADRQGPASQSPFRASNKATRIIAAHQMIEQRTAEAREIERLLDRAATVKERRVLTQRLQGTMNNLRSWEKYVADNSPREPRAVIHPAA